MSSKLQSPLYKSKRFREVTADILGVRITRKIYSHLILCCCLVRSTNGVVLPASMFVLVGHV